MITILSADVCPLSFHFRSPRVAKALARCPATSSYGPLAATLDRLSLFLADRPF
jgi:hypothetical protein